MIGGHFIKGWARTQNHVTVSSAEAELVGPFLGIGPKQAIISPTIVFHLCVRRRWPQSRLHRGWPSKLNKMGEGDPMNQII